MGFMSGLGGFSEGFGKAFSNSFDTARQLAARKEEREAENQKDVLLQTMKDNAKRAEDLAEAEKKDKAIVTKAKALATAYDAPADKIAQMGRDAGGDFTEIETLLKNGKFTSSAANSITTNSSINQTRASTPQNQMPGLDENSASLQTASATGQGLDGGDGIAERPASSTASEDMGDGYSYTRNPVQQDFNKISSNNQAALADALNSGDQEAIDAARAKVGNDRIAHETFNPPNATGRTAFDVRKELADAIRNKDTTKATELQNILTEQNKIELNAKTLSGGPQAVVAVVDGETKVVAGIPKQDDQGNVHFEDRQGNVLVGATLQSEDEKKAIGEIESRAMGGERDKQVTRIADTGSALSSASKLVKMVDTEPGILDNITGGVASFIDQGISEVKTSAKVLGLTIQQDAQGQISADSMQALEDRVAELRTQPISDLAQQQALFNAEISILAYRAGAAEGQTGQAFTEKDFGRIQNALRGNTNDPTTFKSALANYMNGVVRRVDGQTKLMTENNPMINRFEDTYGYSPTRQLVPYMQDFISDQDDEDAKMGLDFVRENAGKNTIGSGTTQEQTSSGPQVGVVEEGYRFKGGDPGDQNNWEKVN